MSLNLFSFNLLTICLISTDEIVDVRHVPVDKLLVSVDFLFFFFLLILSVSIKYLFIHVSKRPECPSLTLVSYQYDFYCWEVHDPKMFSI